MWTVKFDPSVEKSLSKLDKSLRAKINAYLNRTELLENPRDFGKPLLHERKGQWRYRVGNYRIVCKIIDKELIVLVVEVDHRKDIYQK